jgi:hypothetical protein
MFELVSKWSPEIVEICEMNPTFPAVLEPGSWRALHIAGC